MAALLIGGVILGVDKLKHHRAAKRAEKQALLTATQETTRKETYFQSSKAAEAAKEARRARRRERRERRGLGGGVGDVRGSESGSGSGGESEEDGDAELGPPPAYFEGGQEVGEGSGSASATTRPAGPSQNEAVPPYNHHTKDQRISHPVAPTRDAVTPGSTNTSSPATMTPRGLGMGMTGAQRPAR